MSGAALTLAFSAGMVAAVNPCGFALLPAYLSYYLGLDVTNGESKPRSDEPVMPGGPRRSAPVRSGAARTMLAALMVGAAMTAGFVVVFGVFGLVWTGLSDALGSKLPWVVVGIGAAMIVLGVTMTAGFEPVLRLPHLHARRGSRSVGSAFVFGIGYGVASLSCAIGPFIAAVVTTFRHHRFVDGVATLVMYALGMGTLVTGLTVAVGYARLGVVNRLRSIAPRLGRLSGILVILSGLLAVYYGWYEARILTGAPSSGGLAARIADVQQSIAASIQSLGTARLGMAVAAVIATVTATVLWRRHHDTTDKETDEPRTT
ncbi:MAG: cytochrome c biogenesis protein CcdA [Microthrixaceae bacterium]